MPICFGGRVIRSERKQLLCGQVPLLLAALEEGGAVFGKDPAVFDELVEGVGVEAEVNVLALVALFNGFARVAGALAVGGGFGEGDPGGFKGDALIGCADGGVAEVPWGVSGERCGEFGEADAVALVAVDVDLGNEDRE